MNYFTKLSERRQLSLLFFLIVLLHILFKTYQLTASGFWYDETFGINFSMQDWGLIKHTSEWDLNAPLYYYFLWIWRNLFGIGEFSIRFSSVLFSSLTAGMLFLFAMRFFNKYTALLTLVLFTASNEMFFYAHEARCYALLFFLSICSSYCYFTLQSKKSMMALVFLGVCNFLLIYLHYLSGLILVFQAILLVLFYQPVFLKQVSYSFLITLVLSAWRFTKKTILLLLNHEKSFWLSKPSFEDLKNTVSDLCNGSGFFFFYSLLILTSLSFILFANKRISLKSINTFKVLYLFLCSIGTLLLFYFISQFSPLFTKRYVVYTLPFFFLFVGFVVSLIPYFKVRYVLMALCLGSSLLALSKIDFSTPKPMNYRDAVAFVKKEQTPETAILIETKDLGALFSYYYDIALFKDCKNIKENLGKQHIFLISSPEDLQQVDLKKFNKAIWLQSFEKLNINHANLLQTITTAYQRHKTVSHFSGVTILILTN